MSKKEEIISVSETTVSDDTLERFTRAFEASARRWELIIYPSLVAFILLAGYGFYLIYSMTHDVHRVTKQMDTMVEAMVVVSKNMTLVGNNMRLISTEMGEVSGNMTHMSDKFDEAVSIARHMDNSVASLVPVANQMSYDMNKLTYRMHDVTRPMSFMSKFIP